MDARNRRAALSGAAILFCLCAAEAEARGSVTLSWTPPTRNSDGSTYTDLASYRVYYGRKRGSLNRRITIRNPGLTRYVVEDLPRARWHFAMTTVNSRGQESRRSPTLSKTVR
jgi:hypothetical protein